MRKVREVLRLLHALGLSYRKISEATGVSGGRRGSMTRILIGASSLSQTTAGERDLRSLAELTNWDFADFVFGCGYNQISDLTRLRNAGWSGANPSEAMYLRLIVQLRHDHIIP